MVAKRLFWYGTTKSLSSAGLQSGEWWNFFLFSVDFCPGCSIDTALDYRYSMS